MIINLSLSGATDRYLEMFQTLPIYGEYQKDIKERIKVWSKNFKRADAILWMCRRYKLALCIEAGKKGDEDTYQAIRKKDLQRWGIKDLWDLRTFKEVETNLLHYFSLEIPALTKVKWDVDWDLLNVTFADIEKEWQKEMQDFDAELVPTYGKVFIKFPDKSAWWDLEKEYCKTEGNAMGHCGNSAAPRSGDTVLSYRVPTKNSEGDGMQRPSLTFVLHSNGYLGEMKGRRNNKPSDKYHKQIIKLLLDKRIKGIEGGGHDPANNFDLDDLPQADKVMLLEKKPELIPTIELLENYLRDNAKYEEAVCKRLEIKDPKEIVIGEYTSLEEFAVAFNLTSLENYANEEYITDNIYDNSGGEPLDESNVSALLAKLQRDHRDIYTKIEARMEAENIDEEEPEYTNLMEFITEYDEELKGAFESAQLSGQETGACNDYYESITSYLSSEGIKREDFPNVEFTVTLKQLCRAVVNNEVDINSWVADGKPNITEYLDSYNRSGFREDVIDSDYDPPYYGFGGYDESAAYERLVDELQHNVL